MELDIYRWYMPYSIYIVYISLATRLWSPMLRFVYDNTKLNNVQERRVHLINWSKPYKFCTEHSLYFVNVLRLSCTLYNHLSRCHKTRLVVTTHVCSIRSYIKYRCIQRPYFSTRGCKPELLSIIDCYWSSFVAYLTFHKTVETSNGTNNHYSSRISLRWESIE